MRKKRRRYHDPSGAWRWDGGAWVWYLDSSVRRERRGWRVRGQYASPAQAMAALLESVAYETMPDAFRAHVDAYRESGRWHLIAATVPDGLSVMAEHLQDQVDDGEGVDFEEIDAENTVVEWREWQEESADAPWFRWMSEVEVLATQSVGAVFIYPSSANVHVFARLGFRPFEDVTTAVETQRLVRVLMYRHGDDVKFFGVQGWIVADTSSTSKRRGLGERASRPGKSSPGGTTASGTRRTGAKGRRGRRSKKS